MVMQALLFTLGVGFACGLSLQHRDKTAGNFAYVTMVFDSDVLTPEEKSMIHQPQDKNRNTWKPYLKAHPEMVEAKHRSLGRETLGWTQAVQHLQILEEDPSAGAVGEAHSRPRHTGKYSGPVHRQKSFDLVITRARELRKQGSVHPLVVMTNLPDEHIPVNQSVLEKFNIVPLKMDKFFTNRTCMAAEGYAEALQKILIFGLTQYDKMMWIDLDTAMRRNPDRNFDTDLNGGLLGLRSDMWCDRVPGFVQPPEVKERGDLMRKHEEIEEYRNWHDMATSIFLFEPNLADLQGMIDIANTMPFCITDQNLIVDHFWRKGREKVMFMKADTAVWARCTTQGLETDIVHKEYNLAWNGGGIGGTARYPPGWVNPAALPKNY